MGLALLPLHFQPEQGSTDNLVLGSLCFQPKL